MAELIVRGAPQEYVCEVGSWKTLEEHLKRRLLKRVLVLHGEKSWRVAEAKFPELNEVEAVFDTYHFECTDAEVARVVALVKAENCEAIIGVGGGKVADVVKAACHVLGIAAIIMPTLAATCAAYTPLSVMYNEAGQMLRYDVFPRSNALVLIDPEVILDSPFELMVAGIGDTLAKWYEADVIIRQLEKSSAEIDVAYFAAKMCRDNLLALSSAALTAMRTGQLNEAFVKTVETNIMIGGMVGGFGDDYGRTSGAHSIHDALTTQEASHRVLHGNKVAYGILVQLVIEGNWAEIEQLLPFYRELGLPASLFDMEMGDLSAEELQIVAERATEPGETIHMMGEGITSEVVYQAMIQLEDYMAQKRVDQNQ
ncbi:iron-containing alcohol dehydrogenase family protein [Listeria ilorinensis]|uniref:iron-containing alcohol dehydrogenase family protein n=1 Tax=Listeria ilorinensis TaxID=2867439 RepID=UPI001EF6C16E|nr:iron-containing alcohol dehydrogenase family protein [Listeria ilorinensis]